LARKRRHFFYLRPDVLTPVGYRAIVACKGPALSLLATPAHSVEHMPNTTGVVPDIKQLPDQLSDPIQGPVVASVTVFKGASLQFALQALQLGRR
jgi:hypothetical protein